MKTIIRGLLFRACLLVTLIVSRVFLTYGKDGSSVVHIVRNEAWNDLVSQIKFVPENSPEDSIDKEMVVIQKFLNAHQTESELISTTWKYSRPLIGHELACIKPIGTWKRHETSCPTRKGKQCLGGDLWNSGQLSSARNVNALLYRARASVSSTLKFLASRVTTFFTGNLVAGTAGKLTCRKVSRDDVRIHGRTDIIGCLNKPKEPTRAFGEVV